MKPVQEIAGVQPYRGTQAPLGDTCLERGDVGPDEARIDRDLVMSDGPNHIDPEALPETVDGLAQGGSGAALVELRPEHVQDAIAPLGVMRRLQAEEREQRELLRLEREVNASVCGVTLDPWRTERCEADHPPSSALQLRMPMVRVW